MKAAISGLVLCTLFLTVASMSTLDVYRLVQYEVANAEGTTQFGSQRARVSLEAAGYTPGAKSPRSLVILRWNDVTSEVIADLSVDGRMGGLLILLPARSNEGYSDADWSVLLKLWSEREHELVGTKFAAPVYFVYEDEEISELYSVLNGGSLSASLTHSYRVTVATADGTAIKTVPVTNIQGTLRGATPRSASTTPLPTLAVVAHYDAFAAAPALANGTDSNGSGVVALLELARMFSKLYTAGRSTPPAHLLFVLTGAGHFNFAGTKFLLSNEDEPAIRTADFVLCLDSLASKSRELYLHASKIHKEGPLGDLFNEMRETAAAMDFPLEFVHRKINISSNVIHWEHERFSRERVPAATLSSKAEPTPNMEAPNLLDTLASVDETHLRRNILFVAEVLARHLFGLHGKGIEVFGGSLGVDATLVSAWMKYLSVTPRAAAFTQKDSPFLAALEQGLKTYVDGTTRFEFTVDAPEYVFYSQTQAKMTLFKTKSIVFDLVVLVGVCVYLLAIAVVLQGSAAFRPILALFRRSSGPASSTASKKKDKDS